MSAPATSSPLASSAVKVGVNRKLFHNAPLGGSTAQPPSRSCAKEPSAALKRKLIPSDSAAAPSSFSSPLASSSSREGDKENGAPYEANQQRTSSEDVPTLPPHKRESRLKKLKSVTSLTDRGSSGHPPLKHTAQAVPLAQGVALPPPLDLETLLQAQRNLNPAVSSDSAGAVGTRAPGTMLSNSSDETLKQLANIVARKRRGGAGGLPEQAPSSSLTPDATPVSRPCKKARSLCGNEASKLIHRRTEGRSDEDEGEDGDAADVHQSSSGRVVLPHTRRRQRQGHARRSSYDASQLWLARFHAENQAAQALTESSATRRTAPALSSVFSRLVLRPVPLWSELQSKDSSEGSSATVKGSPGQAERRRRRSRSVGDLKQLMAASDEAAAAAQNSAQPPKKRERRRKRNSLVRAIDKLISVAGIAVNKDEDQTASSTVEESDKHIDKTSREISDDHQQTRDRANTIDTYEEDCLNYTDVSVQGGTMLDILRYVSIFNWKTITLPEETSDSIAERKVMVWKDRSMALNFLFGLRRWKVSSKDLFALVLEEYHFGPKVCIKKHLARDLEQERKDMKSLRQRLAAFIHLWVLYNYKSEKEKRLVGRFLDLLKRDGLQDEVKEIQLKIWNACQEQDKLQAIQKLTPKRRPGIPAVAASPMASPRRPIVGSVATQNPIYSASPSPRRPPPSSLRPTSSLISKGAGASSTPVRTPLRSGRTPAVPPTPPKTPSSSTNSSGAVSMLTLSTTAVAKQLSRIEYDLFCAVPASEFMDICKSNVPRPSLSRLVEHTNKISYWVATQIVTLSRNKDKAKMLHKFITLAEKCLRLRNFASASAILIGLNLSLITRMKDVWEALPSKQLALFEKIKAIPMADANYRRLRSLVRREKVRLERLEMLSQHLKDVDPALLAAPQSTSGSSTIDTNETGNDGSNAMELIPPVIPFMAIYNKDFTFVEEQPNNYSDGRINYDKMQIVGGLLREIHLFQHQLSSIDSIESDPVVEDYLANITYLSEETLWSLSGIHTSLRS